MGDPAANPYVGPRPFEAGEGERFFGRDRESDEIVAMVLGHQISIVYAQSGAGKTSLFNARVLHALRDEEGCVTVPLLRVGGAMPEGVRADDVANVYAFRALSQLLPDEDLARLAGSTLADRLARIERPSQVEGHPVPLVVVFDQFEELFTSGSPGGWADKAEVFDQFRAAVRADRYLRIVLVMREDYIAQLDPLAARMPGRLRVRFRLERLRRDAAIAAVEGPALRAGRPFASGAAATLVDALLETREVVEPGETVLVAGRYVEPVQLQVACFSLWKHLPPGGDEISAADVEAFGDVERALSGFYEESIRELAASADVSEALLRRWFGGTLITSARTRAAVMEEEDVTGGIPTEVVWRAEAMHLIRAERRAGARWYELTHDSFIAPILTSNERWRAGEGRNPLTHEAEEWERLGRDEGSLLRGARLTEAEAWASTHERELDAMDLEREFLAASRDGKAAEWRASRTRFRAAAVVLTLVAVLLGVLAGVALSERGAAQRAAADAISEGRAADRAAADAIEQQRLARMAATEAENRRYEAVAAQEEARDAYDEVQVALWEAEARLAIAEEAIGNLEALIADLDEEQLSDEARASVAEAAEASGELSASLDVTATTVDDGVRTSADLRELWDPPCEASWETLGLHSGAQLTIHPQTVETFQAVDQIMEGFGYRPRRADTGAFNCIRIAGGDNYSLHAYGIAADYNWETNPYARRLITDMPSEMVDAILAIRTNDGLRVLTWGGDYDRNKDPMHFHVIASPAELTAGIDPATVAGP